MQTAESCALYDQSIALLEGLAGEILNGQLHAQPRPAAPHRRAESVPQIKLGGPGGSLVSGMRHRLMNHGIHGKTRKSIVGLVAQTIFRVFRVFRGQQ